jgi:ABC-2 type transport system ATP-binding protein
MANGRSVSCSRTWVRTTRRTRRRLDVAIGIVGRPELLFLDEPTAGFDPEARREFHDLVHRLADREEATIMLTTHDLDEAEKLADRILILAGGRIVADGSADELSRRMSTQAEVRWSRDGQRFVHSADEPTRFVRELFRQYGESVEDLEVRRASLEDTYMALVRQAETEGYGSGLGGDEVTRTFTVVAG